MMFYRQDCPKGRSAGIIFTQGRFSEWYDAPIKVKFGRRSRRVEFGILPI